MGTEINPFSEEKIPPQSHAIYIEQSHLFINFFGQALSSAPLIDEHPSKPEGMM